MLIAIIIFVIIVFSILLAVGGTAYNLVNPESVEEHEKLMEEDKIALKNMALFILVIIMLFLIGITQ